MNLIVWSYIMGILVLVIVSVIAVFSMRFAFVITTKKSSMKHNEAQVCLRAYLASTFVAGTWMIAALGSDLAYPEHAQEIAAFLGLLCLAYVIQGISVCNLASRKIEENRKMTGSAP